MFRRFIFSVAGCGLYFISIGKVILKRGRVIIEKLIQYAALAGSAR